MTAYANTPPCKGCGGRVDPLIENRGEVLTWYTFCPKCRQFMAYAKRIMSQRPRSRR